MYFSEKIIILWIVTLILWGLISLIDHFIQSKKVKAVERQAMSTFLLQKELKRLNDRIECKACAGVQSKKEGEAE